MNKIQGVIVPFLTPFDGRGEVDLPAVRPTVDFLIERGVAGLFPGGTTGEGPLLAAQERRQLAEAVVEAAGGRVPVIVHVGAISTPETAELARHAQATGADAVAIVAPYYYSYGDEALFRHFEQVAAQVPNLPIYLYHNPFVGRSRLTVALFTRLVAEVSNMTGVKDSSSNLELVRAGIPLRGGQLNIASGDDGLILAAMAIGADACVSGNSNVVPELVVALARAAAGGDVPRAREIQARLDAVRAILADGSDLSLFKGVLELRGVPAGMVRGPMLQAPEARIRECWQALSALDLDLVPV
jgi:dihydrodipicolinate synthase/N-acetylneuraminate lyase